MTDGPLSGVRVVVTRPQDQAASLVEALEAEGATAVPVPVIEIADPEDGGVALRSALGSLGAHDWLVLTSPNGAARVSEARPDGLPPGVQVAVIGPGTRDRAEALGMAVDLVPDRSIAEGLVAVFPSPPAGGGRVVLARAQIARSELPHQLSARGWRVDDVPAYRTLPVEVDDEQRRQCRHADVVAFTSSSTVTHLLAGAGRENLPPVIACIGPATAATAREAGLHVDVQAIEHTVPGLVAAIVGHIADVVLLRPEPADSDDARWLLDRYHAELDDRFGNGSAGDAMMTTDPEEVAPPNGLFLVARLAGRPVGCGVLKIVEPGGSADSDGGVADIGRMWVSERVRGRGLGRRLLRRLVSEGRALGLRRVQLETDRVLTEAIALYEAEGFVEVEPFNDEPNGHQWFALDL